MLFHRSAFRVALCLVCASVGAAWQSVTLNLSTLEASAREVLDATKTPGAAIGIVQAGRLVYAKGFGTSNIETGAPVASDTLFRLGSTTKMPTATAVATLVAEGKLDFADTVGKHIPGLDPAIAALVVNQILNHTSGLKDTAVMNGRHDDSALGEEIRAWKPDWLFTKPGAIYSYANPGYWLAGFLAESVAGKPYADVMEERVFGPVGMSSSTLRPTMAMTRALSQGHEMVNQKIAVLRPAPDNVANWPAGSVYSNLIDLSRFEIALMNDGKIDGKQALSPKVVTALTTPHADIPGARLKYGYGLELEELGGVRVWSHDGSRAGRGGAGGRGGGGGGGGGRGGGGGADPQNVPEEYRGWTGRITEEKTIPQIKQFVESGGAVVTVGSSTSMAGLLGVPLANALTERGADGQERALPRDKFYIPGSLMRARIDNTNPLAYGMPETVDVFFDNNPVFRLPAEAKAKGETPVAWFSGRETLDSGWALGQELLDGATAVVEAKAGEGKVFVMGPEVTFRGEPDGTFKLLFNGLFYGAAKPATLR